MKTNPGYIEGYIHHEYKFYYKYEIRLEQGDTIILLTLHIDFTIQRGI
jgi:hypothetical protein